jgi:hypothetical protein
MQKIKDFDDAVTVIIAALNRKDERVYDALYLLASMAGYQITPADAEVDAEYAGAKSAS